MSTSDNGILTGRYRFKPGLFTGRLYVEVEVYVAPNWLGKNIGGYYWRTATYKDLTALEPTSADGMRFPAERCGNFDPATGRRHHD